MADKNSNKLMVPQGGMLRDLPNRVTQTVCAIDRWSGWLWCCCWFVLPLLPGADWSW